MATRDPRTGGPARRPVPRRREGLDYHWDLPPGVGPAAPRPPDERNEIILMSGLNVLAGIWLVIAPWVLGYWSSDPRWNDVACGVVIGLLALTRATGAFRAVWLSWTNALIGAWLFVAAFAIDSSAAAGWNDAVVGALVFLLAVGSAAATERLLPRRRPSQPWRA